MNHLETELDIKFNGQYNKAFVRANHWIITLNQELLYQSGNPEEILNNLWMEKFNAKIEKENDIPSKLVFLTRQNLTVFMLRWG